MSSVSTFRSLIPLLIGLGLGVVGATMFLESMPGSEGSPEERANKLELELDSAKKRLAALEAADARDRNQRDSSGGHSSSGDARERRRPGRTFADGARSIAEDLREGRPVSPEDIFRASQPLMRDLAPLFDRMRVKQQREMIDSMTGELARKYHLTPQNQEALKQWFAAKADEEAKRWTEMIGREGTRLEDVMRASQNVRPDEGLDHFMEGMLSGDKLTAFKTERTTERAERVQQEADRKVQRLDSIVGLDDAQREQVFGIVARSSRDYEPTMQLEGLAGEIGSTPGGNRQAAMLSVLKPEQHAAYEAERQRRRIEASKDLEAMGLTLPPDWEMLDAGDFQ